MTVSVTPAGLLAGVVDSATAPRPLSVFDLFRIGLGPSSSHTVGPMRAAGATSRQLKELASSHQAETMIIERIQIELHGSLGATGRGHATDRAVICGLEGYQPDQVTSQQVESVNQRVFIQRTGLQLPGLGTVPFQPEADLIFSPFSVLPYHTNALTIKVYGHWETSSRPGIEINNSYQKTTTPVTSTLLTRTFYSIGGGFVMEETGDPQNPQPKALATQSALAAHSKPAPYPFRNGKELIEIAQKTGLSIAQIVRANEESARPAAEIDAYLDLITDTMLECIFAGCATSGELPGGLHVKRRAEALGKRLAERDGQPATGASWAGTSLDSFRAVDWVNLWALAVNEENAAGHRVVTAPTNGAAGVIPAVLGYLIRFCPEGRLIGQDQEQSSTGANPLELNHGGLPSLNAIQAARPACRDYLLAACAIGAIIKTNASIAGAEVGCQGEIGSAASMAAAGLAQALGARPEQVENAAEIAMEHHLGLTCDPVGGLVQIPCIERNAIAAVKAINSARMSLWGDGRHTVSLDAVVETMRQTGCDMHAKYKETAQGGLAVSVVEC